MVACSDRPAREKFPGAAGRTTEIQQAQSQQAVLGGFDPTKRPLAGAGENPAESSQGFVKGVVRLGKNIKPKPGMFFFLAVRRPKGGPPIAVRREVDAKFPYEFSLSGADAMIPGTPFEGPVVISARLKADSDPLSRKSGDVSGQVNTKVGDHSIQVTLDQVEN